MNFTRHLLNTSGYTHAVPTDTWNVVLYQLPAADAVSLLEMLQAHEDAKVDSHSFTAVMSALGDAEDMPGAFKMLEKMKQLGYEPNAMTYNTLILNSGNAGALDLAVQALEEMEERGLFPLMEVYDMLAALAEHEGKPDMAKRFAMRRDEIQAAKEKAGGDIDAEFGLGGGP